jgi:chromate transporter
VAAQFLDGVNVASLALMAVVTVQLARAALVDSLTLLLALGSAVALIRFKVNTTWLVAVGAGIGALGGALRG